MIWWGRFDPEYSRNRIIRGLLHKDGWDIVDFVPQVSVLGYFEAAWKRLPASQWIWVPCFRHHDFWAASHFARRHSIPLLFDPLISTYDKQVLERVKLRHDSWAAARLLRKETRMIRAAQRVLVDTAEHGRFFGETLGASDEQVAVVPVGAEEGLFFPQPYGEQRKKLEVLFYGSYIPLQGVEYIVEAARSVPEVKWTFLGDGPSRQRCERSVGNLEHIRFEDPVRYCDLPSRIGDADILLGVFGKTPKALRVIPNKVYQALACSRPVITMDAPVYGEAVRAASNGGIAWVPPGDPSALARMVRGWLTDRDCLRDRGLAARSIYERFYSNVHVLDALKRAL